MCLKICSKALVANGNIIIKTIQGGLERSLFYTLELFFKNAYRFKPKSSRSTSSELYIVGKEFDDEKRQILAQIDHVPFDSTDTKVSISDKFHSRAKTS
jgi:hypothetical protein